MLAELLDSHMAADVEHVQSTSTCSTGSYRLCVKSDLKHI